MLHLMSRLRSALAGMVLLLLASTADATVIFRWVDENGRMHMSDVVPEKYKDTATRIDSQQFELSPEQEKAAQERAAREKALAEEAARQRMNAAPEKPLPPLPQHSEPVKTKIPAQGVTDQTDCETWRRLYRESQACFGPYRTVGGGIKPEAFERCTEIPSPEVKCGPWRK